MALDIEKYRERLLEEQARLNEEITATVAEAAEAAPEDRQITAANAPIMSEAVDIQDSIVVLKTHRLERINTALQMIDEGTYGTCIKCGRQIDPRRLDADPAALTCIEDAKQEDANIVTPSL